MLSLTKVAALLTLGASFAVAAPAHTCIDDTNAKQVADNFATLVSAYSDDLATNALTEDFHDYSSSVNTLINTCPQGDAAKQVDLNAATFSSREEFMTSQGSQPPIHFKILKQWVSCSTVNLRWLSDNTANITNPRPVYGVVALETVPSSSGSKFAYQIKTVYSEFNSGAWLQNLQDAGVCKNASIGTGGGAGGQTGGGEGGTSGNGGGDQDGTEQHRQAHNQGQRYDGETNPCP